MIDEKRLIRYIKTEINPYGKPFEGSVYDFGLKLMDYIENMGKSCGWIPCSQRMPENEVDVLIAYSVGDTKCHIAMAFYEDGTKTTEESDYWWNDIDNFEYSEKDRCFFIPEGWWEAVTFTDEFKPVDREVVAWMPLPEPPTVGQYELR